MVFSEPDSWSRTGWQEWPPWEVPSNWANALSRKALLSNVLGWTGGNGGTQSSPITPANISQLTQKYTNVVDGAIVAEPLVASVNITVGPNPGNQSVVFVATQGDGLYAFNVNTGQLDWHRSFLIPGQTALTPIELDFNGSGVIGTPVIDSAANTMYLVSSESYGAGNVTPLHQDPPRDRHE